MNLPTKSTSGHQRCREVQLKLQKITFGNIKVQFYQGPTMTTTDSISPRNAKYFFSFNNRQTSRLHDFLIKFCNSFFRQNFEKLTIRTV